MASYCTKVNSFHLLSLDTLTFFYQTVIFAEAYLAVFYASDCVKLLDFNTRNVKFVDWEGALASPPA